MRSSRDNFSTVEQHTSQSNDNASKSTSPLRTKAVEPVLKFQATDPGIQFFWLQFQHLEAFGSVCSSRTIWSKKSEKNIVLFV